uniref:Ig-like domain-containing protein n=1 Tax=Poecilia reticulata TaxID=8081 RepID=A0A3P9PKN1_POERE
FVLGSSVVSVLILVMFISFPCVNAAAGSDAILNCKLPVNTHQIFDWKKTDTSPAQEVFLYERGSHYNNGKSGQNEHFIKRVEFFEDQLQFGNASIRIKNTKLTDSGIYSCEFPKLDLPELKTYVKLVVGKYKTFAPMVIIFHSQLINSFNNNDFLSHQRLGSNYFPSSLQGLI